MGTNNRCNYINFIRGEIAHRGHMLDYMFEQVYEETQLAKKYNIEATFLLEYDALIEPTFSDFLKKEQGDLIEIGAWLETPQRLIEDAGLEWRGREGFTWDWFCDVGFLTGYTPEERIKIIDTYFAKFKEIFGKYPEVIGSWHIDAVSLKYINDTYNVVACCICREQVGIDGYTLWGGNLNGYYPTINNSFTPATSIEKQIDIPIFRMLGEDRIYNYDYPYLVENMGYNSKLNTANTMEPASKTRGGHDVWVKWFLNEFVNPLNNKFSYLQIGQENGFGWEKVKNGLNIQLSLIKEMAEKGQLVVEKLSKTGKWFKENFKQTPAAVTAAESDWLNSARKSYWYASKNYRSNIYVENKHLWIRDFYAFSDTYKERWLEKPVRTHGITYDNLPIIDGFNWSDEFVRAGIYPVVILKDTPKMPDIITYKAEENNGILTVTADTTAGKIKMILSEDKITLENDANIVWNIRYTTLNESIANAPDNAASTKYNDTITAWDNNILGWDKKSVNYEHSGNKYSLSLEDGTVCECSKAGSIMLVPNECGKLTLKVTY